MRLKRLIFSLILIEVAAKDFLKVQALQCYVCENCNEYEDFKELHICGEIPNETIMKPDTSVSSATKEPTNKPSVESSSQPTAKPLIDDYLNEDNDEKHDDGDSQNYNQEKTTKAASTKTTTTTNFTTQKPTSLAEASSSLTKKPNAELTSTTTQSLVASVQQEITQASSSENKTGTTTTATIAVTSTKPKPVIISDYDDYFEYEDPIKVEGRSSKSLSKINEPVCYMIKYHVNNTVYTNRGCTTFINANKYLTCQSLYNGAPMESCRVCSTNGCNKFLDDAADEENQGIYSNAAGALRHLGFSTVISWILLIRKII